MIYLIHRCFPDQIKAEAGQETLQRMIPSYGHSLVKEPGLLRSVRERVNRVLGLSDRDA
jgi:malate dehydrogenase (quinone)